MIIALLQDLGLIWIRLFQHYLHENNIFIGGLHFHPSTTTHRLIPFAKMERLLGG
jgi:hypothetical protein